MERKPFSELDLRRIITDTREVSDRPYMLYAAFILSDIYDVIADGEEEDFSIDDMWGQKIPQKILDRLINDTIEDFCSAAENHLQINVFGHPYSIRRVNAFDRQQLKETIAFPIENGEYIITKSGVMDLGNIGTPTYLAAKEELEECRSYFRKIVMVAEDDENDGYDKLSDMECAFYCWGIYFCKTTRNNAIEWHEKYKKYYCLTLDEVKEGWNERSRLMNKPHGLYTFSAKAIREWNKKNGQGSIIDGVDEKEAEKYWYDVALKKRFRNFNNKWPDR